MTFLQLQQEVQDRLKAYDLTDSADTIRIKRWLNMAIQYICGKRIWPFQVAEEIITTVPDYTTGTCSTSADSTSITFSTAPTTSKTNFYIQFISSNDWYKITSHTASSTTATISPAAINGASAVTFKIRKLLYTTTTPLISILDMKQLITPALLVSMNPREADVFLPLYYSAGSVYDYILTSPTSAGTPQFSLLYAPNAAINIMIRGLKALSDLSADADVPVIPAPWHDAIVNIGSYFGFKSLDDSRAKEELEIGELRIGDMGRVYAADLGRHRVMRSVQANSEYALQWSLPSEFGPMAD